MEPKMLLAEKHTDPETGFLCRYVKSNTEYFRPHNHDYYELFLILKGNVSHTVNSMVQTLHQGQLLFIRDFDVHDYKSADGDYFEFINLAFKKDYLTSLFNYLGEGFSQDVLFSSSFPPVVNLSSSKEKQLFYSLTELNRNQETDCLCSKFKVLLLNIFYQYFFDYSEETPSVPLWLEITYEKMKNPKNFIEGLDKMCEISGRSYAHLARSFKKHYGVTPTDYITDLRLEYSVSLLFNSNLSITDIGYSCGFENISWFYKMFEKKYKQSPGKYRKDRKTTQVQVAPVSPPETKGDTK